MTYLWAVPTAVPALMEPAQAAEALRTSIKNPQSPRTIADAAAESGLALRDAERGLHWLTSEYRGHLRVTGKGELLFLFPTGFAKPWERRDALVRGFDATARVAVGIGRFVARAWLTIVLFAYAGVFLALLVGLMFARSNNDSSSRGGLPGGEAAYVLLRVLGDALFWTFHPFSPLALNMNTSPRGFSRRPARDGTPFYEKVNRFFFGPTVAPDDARAVERTVLAQMRAQKGRIGLADVMRVTGWTREQADPFMAKLMLDYDGEVDVSSAGGITFKFEAVRKTGLSDAPIGTPRPAWETPKKLAPLTANPVGTNVLIAVLNLFNILASLFAISTDLTLSKLPLALGKIPLMELPYDGPAVVLGWIPLLFSLGLFAIPIGRAAVRPVKKRATARDNGRLAILREVLTRMEKKQPVTDRALSDAWKRATGQTPASAEITRRVVALGGDVDLESTEGVRYRFSELETEADALEQERRIAPDEEAKVGNVVFASDR